MNTKNNKTKINKKAFASLNFIILMMVAIIFIMGGLTFVVKTMAINELQGIMDKSGIIALRSSVDETKFRRGELYLEKARAKKEFESNVAKSLNVGSGSLLTGYRVKEVNIYSPGDRGIKGLGIDNGNNDQYFLEAVIVATFNADPIVDGLVSTSISFFDFFTSNKETSSLASGSVKDGTMEVIVRSVTRVVMR